LYGGAAGIAWFLGHIAAHDPSGTFATAASDGLRFAIAEVSNNLESDDPSLLSGSTGVAVAAMTVADRLGLNELQHSAASLAQRSAEKIQALTKTQNDLIAGTAGGIIGLLALHRACGDQFLLEACRKACDGLLATGIKQWWGRSWPERDNVPALCGLGHGMSGIGWALAETAWATGERRFFSGALEAFRYERSWFSPEQCGWPDLRDPSERSVGDGTWPGLMTAWCHGALGIGAVRLRFYEATRDTTALAEASAAIQAGRLLAMRAGADLRNNQLSDASLCHDLGGVAELFLLAHEVFNSNDHLRAARRVGDFSLEICRRNDRRWTLGVRGGERVPGLFLGLAGIGVTLLRLHDTSSIGSPILPGRSASAATSDRD